MFDFFAQYNEPTFEKLPRADDDLGRVCPRERWGSFLESAGYHVCYFVTLTIDPKMKVNGRFLRQLSIKHQTKYLKELYTDAIKKYERSNRTTCYYYNFYEAQRDGTLHLHGMLYLAEDEKNIFNVPVNLRYYFGRVGFRSNRAVKVEPVKYFNDCASYCSKEFGVKNSFTPFHHLEVKSEANDEVIV